MIDYRDILDSMDRGIVTVDLQGEITSCNRALEEILEVEAKTIVGHSLEEVFASEDPLYRLLRIYPRRGTFPGKGPGLYLQKRYD